MRIKDVIYINSIDKYISNYKSLFSYYSISLLRSVNIDTNLLDYKIPKNNKAKITNFKPIHSKIKLFGNVNKINYRLIRIDDGVRVYLNEFKLLVRIETLYNMEKKLFWNFKIKCGDTDVFFSYFKFKESVLDLREISKSSFYEFEKDITSSIKNQLRSNIMAVLCGNGIYSFDNILKLDVDSANYLVDNFFEYKGVQD